MYEAIIYSTNNTKVINSYQYTDNEVELIVDLIMKHRRDNNLPITRTKESYVAEIIAHNRLYKLGIQKERTRDTDLEEHINGLRNIIYKFLGGK